MRTARLTFVFALSCIAMTSAITPVFGATAQSPACKQEPALDASAVASPLPALHAAAFARKYGVAQKLLSNGVDVNQRAWDGSTALILLFTRNIPDPTPAARAAARRQYEKDLIDLPRFAELLLSAKADPAAVDAYGMTALHRLVQSQTGRKIALKLAARLLDTGAGVDQVNHAGVTPLMLAASFGDGAMTDFLTARGANKAKLDCLGRRATDFARSSRHTTLAEKLAE